MVILTKVKSTVKKTFPWLVDLKFRTRQQVVYFKHWNLYSQILKSEQCNAQIAEIIQGNQPAMIARFGSTELTCVAQYLKGFYQEPEIADMRRAAGVFPATKEILDRYCKLFLDSTKLIDVLGVWFLANEAEIVQKYCEKFPSIVNLIDFEPYFHQNPWTQHLAGKKVLVIHPFAETILENYYKRRELLFENQKVLPVFELDVIQAVQSRGNHTGGFSSWFSAYDWLCEQIAMKEFDVAILGCGAYGLPLAGFIKSRSKQAIHLGGATQILFGIKGNRWDTRPAYQALYNSSWIRASARETPAGLEKGWYW